MNPKKVFAIARREYVERVRTKAFWIATLVIPILFGGFIAIHEPDKMTKTECWITQHRRRAIVGAYDRGYR